MNVAAVITLLRNLPLDYEVRIPVMRNTTETSPVISIRVLPGEKTVTLDWYPLK